jgi:hypothetical protein
MAVIVTVLFFAIMIAITSKVLKTDKSSKNASITFKTSKTFVKTYDVKVGEEVNLWLNSNEDEAHFFLKGTHGGQGRIGKTKDWFFVNMAHKDEPNFICVITHIFENEVTIELQFQSPETTLHP